MLPDWPASPWTVRCGRSSISTVTLLVGGERPWLTPTETPGAMYFPALSAVPPVAELPLAARGFRVLLAGPLGPEPSLNQSRPRPPRRRSSTPGPPPARVPAAAASCSPCAAVIWPTPRLNKHARQDLVLRHDGVEAQGDLRRRGDTADHRPVP